ncbi:MAG: DUF1549 and DUF1553 domain-containing protein, partial [Planctomycetota bacterium]
MKRVAALLTAILCHSFVSDARSAETLSEPKLSDSDRGHWAFRPLREVDVPVTTGDATTPIDHFIRVELKKRGLRLMPPAAPEALLRRASLVLLGVPPTPEALDAFANDSRPDAWARQIDTLLGSPLYGERWGQHWLDLARFAETDGFEHDKVRPNAWKYRDWVIGVLNDDMGYDEFLRQQIAGDELYPSSSSAWIATGFALCGPDMPDINSQDERRHVVLNEMTATVGSVALGLQIGCAQCHDHKWDPVSQADFYRLRLFFEGCASFRDEGLPEKGKRGRVLKASKRNTGEGHLRVRGDFRRKGAKLAAGYLRVTNPDANRPKLGTASRLRSQLAQRLTQSNHPLTTRVIANRIWQHHFGKGLVATPSDFGLRGQTPSHPDLLDWLAAELPRRGWSLKAMHRIILLSATFRQAGTPGLSASPQLGADLYETSVRLDPDARLLSRYPRRRLEAETIRDSILAVSGQLSTRRGGPGVMPPLPEEIRKSIRRDHWKVSPDPEDHHRRSVYLFVRRNLRYPFFEVFDRPDTNASCARRDRTTIAPQSLALLNSDLTVQASKRLAASLGTSQEPRSFVRALPISHRLHRRGRHHELQLVVASSFPMGLVEHRLHYR